MFGETFESEGKRGHRCIGQTVLSCKPFTKGCDRVSSSQSLWVYLQSSEHLPCAWLNLLKNREIREVASEVSFPQENNYLVSINRVEFNPLTCSLFVNVSLGEVNSYLRLTDTPLLYFCHHQLFGIVWGFWHLIPRGWWNWLTICLDIL